MQPDVPTSAGPIDQISTGMRVLDSVGAEVGTVATVRPGDPNAVAVQDPPTGSGVLSGKLPHTESGDEPEVSADLAARLLRAGYVKLTPVDPSGMAHYVEADQIAEVAGDTVRLAVPATALAEPRS